MVCHTEYQTAHAAHPASTQASTDKYCSSASCTVKPLAPSAQLSIWGSAVIFLPRGSGKNTLKVVDFKKNR